MSTSRTPPHLPVNKRGVPANFWNLAQSTIAYDGHLSSGTDMCAACTGGEMSRANCCPTSRCALNMPNLPVILSREPLCPPCLPFRASRCSLNYVHFWLLWPLFRCRPSQVRAEILSAPDDTAARTRGAVRGTTASRLEEAARGHMARCSATRHATEPIDRLLFFHE